MCAWSSVICLFTIANPIVYSLKHFYYLYASFFGEMWYFSNYWLSVFANVSKLAGTG